MDIIKKHYIINSAVLCLFSFLSGISSVSAQISEPEKRWKFLTEVYLLFPNMKGETGIGDLVSVPIDANPGDIFSKLKIGGMLYFEARTKKWAITSDLVFMNLENEVTPGTILNSGTVTANQGIWEAVGLFRITSFLEVGAGGRLNHLSTGMDVRRNVFPGGTEEVNRDNTTTWYDPIIIARLTADIRDKWLFQFRGDLGGFGAGSDFTWQLQAYAGYRFSKIFQLTAGYRIISIDYNKDTDAGQFIFNTDEFGPVIRLGFNF
jgi:hypothetical protein